MSIEKIIGGFVSLIMLLVFTPILLSMLHSVSQQPTLTQDNTAIERAKNLSIELDVCKKQVENLSNTVVTKGDLTGIENALKRLNQNTITIYEQNNKFISNYFTFTISITIALTFSVVIGAFSLFDAVFFNMDLTKGFFRRVKKRFSKNGNGKSSVL
mgnify:FL=1